MQLHGSSIVVPPARFDINDSNGKIVFFQAGEEVNLFWYLPKVHRAAARDIT